MREKLGREPFVIVQGRTISLYPEDRKDDFIPSQVEEVKFDKIGRLCLPKKVSHFLRGKKVLLIGEGDHIAIFEESNQLHLPLPGF